MDEDEPDQARTKRLTEAIINDEGFKAALQKMNDDHARFMALASRVTLTDDQKKDLRDVIQREVDEAKEAAKRRAEEEWNELTEWQERRQRDLENDPHYWKRLYQGMVDREEATVRIRKQRVAAIICVGGLIFVLALLKFVTG